MTCSPVLFSSNVKSVLRGRGYAVIHNSGSYKRLVVAYKERGGDDCSDCSYGHEATRPGQNSTAEVGTQMKPNKYYLPVPFFKEGCEIFYNMKNHATFPISTRLKQDA